MDTSPKRKISKVNFIVEPSEVTLHNIEPSSKHLFILAKISEVEYPEKELEFDFWVIWLTIYFTMILVVEEKLENWDSD